MTYLQEKIFTVSGLEYIQRNLITAKFCKQITLRENWVKILLKKDFFLICNGASIRPQYDNTTNQICNVWVQFILLRREMTMSGGASMDCIYIIYQYEKRESFMSMLYYLIVEIYIDVRNKESFF